MPTYEYQCDKCGHRFEKFQSMTSAPIKKCPSCGKNALKRLISGGAGLIFKGSGFYITDYRDSNYKDAAKAASAPAKPAEGSKTESKPASDAKPTEAAKPAAEAKPKAEAKPPTASKSAAKASTKA